MAESRNRKKKRPGDRRKAGGIFYFLLFLALGAVSCIVFLDFAGAYIFDAEIKSAPEIGVGDEIRVDFNQPVFSLDLENISISPFAGFSYHLSENRRSLFLRPNSSFDFEKKYTLTLSGIRAVSGMVMENRSLSFYTTDDPEAIRTIKMPEETFSKLKLAAERYTPPESSRVKKDMDIAPHITEGKYIDVSISHQVMTLFEDGVKVNEFLVSTGKYGMPTPLGQFKIQRKETNHWSYQYKLWMPYSMNFSGPYYIHELPYWPNGYREGENHLGIRVSHGCIRLGIGPAKYVFDWAEIGTSLYIHQ